MDISEFLIGSKELILGSIFSSDIDVLDDCSGVNFGDSSEGLVELGAWVLMVWTRINGVYLCYLTVYLGSSSYDFAVAMFASRLDQSIIAVELT